MERQNDLEEYQGTSEWKLILLKRSVALALSLKEGDISDEDSFVGLGGDSLAAIYVVEELQTSGLDLNPVDLFEESPFRIIALGIRKNDR